ncbi:Endonuclease-reverse transcriptase [Popillia japonica]|uniref:Endonuclease-reverse transcriptase n=1 Tax=Popillia japonica TaxID=7064 RepID=A0AAW1H636_POPJA
MRDVKSKGLYAIIAGDFNAKAPLWGSPFMDKRGEYLMEWAAELNLSVLNSGDTPTFEREGRGSSFIDITWATEGMMKHTSNWEVLLGEVYTYHHHIYFEVQFSGKKLENKTSAHGILDREQFAQSLMHHFKRNNFNGSPSTFTSLVMAMVLK